MRKRITAIILVLMMAVSILPAATFADESIYVSIGGKIFTEIGQTINVGGGTAKLEYVYEGYESPRYKLTVKNVNLTSFTKFAEQEGATYYAGIVFASDDVDFTHFVLEFAGKNTITAPKHSGSAVYEGIVSTVGTSISGTNVIIKGVDVGVDVASGNDPQSPRIRLETQITDMTVNASYADIICEEMDAYKGNYTLNSTGYSCISASSKVQIEPSATVNLSLKPNISKGYGSPVGIYTGDRCAIYGVCNVDVSFNAANYKGGDELTAFGIYSERLLILSKNPQNITVNLQSNGKASAVGVYGMVVSVVEGRELTSNVNISGAHQPSCAVLSGERFVVSGSFDVTITGAGPEDCAIIALGSFELNAESLYAKTDCAAPELGVIYIASTGDVSVLNEKLLYPEGAHFTATSEGNIITDAELKPATEAIFSKRGYTFRDIEDLIDAFKTAILWAAGEGITTGYTPFEFRPNVICNRGQVVTFLWRAAGCPEPKITENPFTDVLETGGTAPYYKAILWAYENGITTGFTETEFMPYEGCTRAQAVTFLWRAQGRAAAETTQNPFTDVSEESVYYPAILWAAENGITTGYEDGAFCPDNQCTRAHIVTFLYRAFHGVLQRVEVKDIRLVFGEDKVAESSKQFTAKPQNIHYSQRNTYEYVSVNCYFELENIMNIGSTYSEDMYTLYLPCNIVDGELKTLDADKINYIGVYNGKAYFSFDFTDGKASGELIAVDYHNNTMENIPINEVTMYEGRLMYLEPIGGFYRLNSINFEANKSNSSLCHGYALHNGSVYCVFAGTKMGESYRYVIKLSVDLTQEEIIFESNPGELIAIDETGYNVTSTVDGETIVTHYDFP